jgi:DNA-binding phage protein
MKGFTKFDASEFLDNKVIIAEYLAAALGKAKLPLPPA